MVEVYENYGVDVWLADKHARMRKDARLKHALAKKERGLAKRSTGSSKRAAEQWFPRAVNKAESDAYDLLERVKSAATFEREDKAAVQGCISETDRMVRHLLGTARNDVDIQKIYDALHAFIDAVSVFILEPMPEKESLAPLEKADVIEEEPYIIRILRARVHKQYLDVDRATREARREQNREIQAAPEPVTEKPDYIRRQEAHTELSRQICSCVGEIGIRSFCAASFSAWRRQHNGELASSELPDTEVGDTIDEAIQDITRFDTWCKEKSNVGLADRSILATLAQRQLYVHTNGLIDVLIAGIAEVMDLERVRRLKMDRQVLKRPKQDRKR